MNRNNHIILLLVFLLLIPSISISKTITGKTISVEDGDTITILNRQRGQTKIRLYGIDTPENGQAFGKKAKKFTSSLVAGKTVRVKIYDTDRYGRSVGVVFVGNTNVNKEIIRAGYAWQYQKYCKASFCSEWLTLEQMAKIARIGLWRDNNPAPPWEWRKAIYVHSSPKATPGSRRYRLAHRVEILSFHLYSKRSKLCHQHKYEILK